MYDVTGVNVFPRKLMAFPRKEKFNSVPYPLLLYNHDVDDDKNVKIALVFINNMNKNTFWFTSFPELHSYA